MQTEKKTNKSRRKFIIRGGLGTLGLLALGTYVFRNPLRRSMLELSESMIPPYMGSGTEANLWFEILKDNTVLLHSPKVEMGQGTFTGLAQIVADELDVSIDQIHVKAAETSTGIIDGMSTGGSLSIAQLWHPLREMAATMRAFIKEAGAKKLNVSSAEISSKNGTLSVGNKSLTYADALADISDWSLPDTPALRPVNAYKSIGKPVPRIDLKDKVMGAPIFGLDATLPNMLYATIIRPEHIGASIKSVDSSGAEGMDGNIKIIKKENYIGVIADSFSEALAARRKVNVEWNIPKIWSEEALREYLKVGKGNKMVTQKEGAALDENDDQTITLEFTSPLGAHAQIEPNGALADVKSDSATIILSTQVIGVTQNQVAEALDMDKEKVNIIGTYLGGGFGRRLNTSHAIQAAELSREVGRPVKYIFTRKEEFQNDTFRPPTHHIVKGKLDINGGLETLEHHYASGDVAINSVMMPPIMLKVLGTDIGAMRGGNIMYDKIQNHRAVQWHKTLPFATSWWRSLGLLANTFAIESFIDEMSIKTQKNPIDFRLNMLGESENSLRIKQVIRKAAEMSNFNNSVTENSAQGFAASIDAGSPCAQVVEVEVKNNRIYVKKVFCAFDCGLAVNPDQVRAQCEGAIIMGISATLHEKMTIQDGRLYPINYGTYQMAMMRDTPSVIEIELIQGVEDPMPVGEPQLGPIGAAIGNAVRRIINKRLTDLPLDLGSLN